MTKNAFTGTPLITARQVVKTVETTSNQLFDPQQRLNLDKIPKYKYLVNIKTRILLKSLIPNDLDIIENPFLSSMVKDILFQDQDRFFSNEFVVPAEYFQNVLKHVKDYVDLNYRDESDEFKLLN